MTSTILTVYRNNTLPVARAEWTARYEAATGEGLRGVLRQLERYVGPEFVWYVCIINT